MSLAAALGLLAAGCDCLKSGHTRAWRADAGDLSQAPAQIDLTVRSRNIPPRTPVPMTGAPTAIRIAPELAAAAATDPERVETLLITFRDPLAAHPDSVRAYAGNPFAPDTGKAAGNAIVTRLRARRAAELTIFGDSLEARHGAVVMPVRFAFAHALLVRMKLKEIQFLEPDPRIVSVEAMWGNEAPQQLSCGTSQDNLERARDMIGSDRYLAAGFGSGNILILDTGVQRDHALLGMDRFPSVLDCVSYPGLCGDGDTNGDVWPGGHGTSTAGVLSANDALGHKHHGLTDASLESYRVYGRPPGETSVKVNQPGAVAAFESILTDDADVIVAEIATGYGTYGALTQEAGWAFDRGAVVVAANGNANTRLLPQPANATRALGVGMYCMQSPGSFRADAAWGRTPDQRIKPDLGAPTGALTAAASDLDPAKLGNFNGTSGSTPMVAGAALLLRNWMRSGGAIVAPGHVYAMLLMCGQNGFVHDSEGAGRIQLPSGGLAWWGSVPVANGKQLTLDFDTGSLAASGIEAAVWWPEYGVGGGMIPSLAERATVSLQALDPKGQPSEPSDREGTVFQRVSLKRAANVTGNKWQLRIGGAYVPGYPRDVYYAVWARP